MTSRFAQRAYDIEIMDDLQLGGDLMTQTLRELEIINRFLGGNNVTIKGVQQLLTNTKTDRVITIADLGCGGGDILKLLANWGRRENRNLSLTGIDANAYVIEYAKKNSTDFPEISYETLNIFSDEFKNRKFDIVTTTLFTHHFTNEKLINLLEKLKKQTRIGIVINDIHRHWFAFHSIKWLTRLFSKSDMVKNDAPLSVLRSFRRQELLAILEKAGIKKFTLNWQWAFRWKLVIHLEPQ